MSISGYKLFVISLSVVLGAMLLFGLTLDRMYVLDPNVIVYIVLALVGATIGFVIYGLIKGFENTFPND